MSESMTPDANELAHWIKTWSQATSARGPTPVSEDGRSARVDGMVSDVDAMETDSDDEWVGISGAAQDVGAPGTRRAQGGGVQLPPLPLWYQKWALFGQNFCSRCKSRRMPPTRLYNLKTCMRCRLDKKIQRAKSRAESTGQAHRQSATPRNASSPSPAFASASATHSHNAPCPIRLGWSWDEATSTWICSIVALSEEKPGEYLHLPMVDNE